MRMRPHITLTALVALLSLVVPVGAIETTERPKSAAAVARPEEAPRPETTQGGRVEVRGEWFYVDGEPFLVKGIGYSPYRPGEVPWKHRVDLALMERDFKRIQEAGFNTIRTWSPLPPDAVALADRYGLMVLQGIWVEHNGDYGSSVFRDAMLQTVSKEAERAKQERNVLGILVGNELQPEQVYHTGIPETEALLKRAWETVKARDTHRLVSYANWPSLSFLDASIWDMVCFNLYPYEPSSISHTFGVSSYVKHLRRTVARGKPLVVTETGLSVSPTPSAKRGYGGLTPATQRTELLALWDGVFQAGAQGGVIFEWNDEWWKGDGTPDAESHDAADPEEWFGLMEFTSPEQVDGTPRPAYEALKTYNQAILLSPVEDEPYQDRVPVTVYATENVVQIRVRLDQGKWWQATKLNRHWWKLQIPLGAKERAGQHAFVMEALDGKQKPLARVQRSVLLSPPQPVPLVSVSTERTLYEVTNAIEPIRYTMTVTDEAGVPLANRTVHWSISEPQSHTDLTQTKVTDAQGRVEATYLIHEPGIVTISAATPRTTLSPVHRVGAETYFVVRQQPVLNHVESPWERDLPKEVKDGLTHDAPLFQLANPGTERIVNYAKYGTFLDVGTAKYRYDITDWEGLAAAVGEGIYPNEAGLLKDPAYQAAKKAGKLKGSHWDFHFANVPQLNFFKWAEAEEELGVKQFYTALALERAGLWLQAVKAYHAVLVHYPTSVGWTAFDPPTPWYVGKVAREKIEAILRLHPELGMRLQDAHVIVQRGFDNDVDNDLITASPGMLVNASAEEVNPLSVDVTTLPKRRQIGNGRVHLVQYENDHWQLLVDGAPWIVHGLTYGPSAVGETPDEGTLRDWMTADRNRNGVIDVLETFVDANRNDTRDPEEPTVGDFQLLKDLGVNTLRLYHTNHVTSISAPRAPGNYKAAKALLRELHKKYGFMVIMGDFVGMYTVGSGAKWEEGTNYLDKTQRKRMTDSVKRMVNEFKDEPYLLMWALGNENNYGGVHGIVGGTGNAGKYPAEYYGFVNELATWIHTADPNHPVSIGNGDLLFLDVIAKAAPAIDVFGANAYRGWQGFGRSFFEEVKRYLDKPVLITEYGCPSYQTDQSREIAERDQALYHLGNWVDLADNMAGRGVGSVIGGIVFEWSDEWWKAGQPPRFLPGMHDTQPNWAGPFPGGWNFEEWYGLVSQGDGQASPFLRQLRVSYKLYRQLWKGATPAP